MTAVYLCCTIVSFPAPAAAWLGSRVPARAIFCEMIVYDSGDYHLAFLCRLEGSAFPRAALFSLPSAGLAVLFAMLLEEHAELDFLNNLNESSVWSASIVVVGILVAFRTNKAYDRFWEGITLVQQMRAEWFEAASNLMAFSEVAAKKNPSNEKMVSDVHDFQFTLIRLMSLMHGAALRQIGGYKEEFPVLDLQGLDEDSLSYLADCEEILSNRVEVLLHWIQVLITDNHIFGVVDVPPPILTRAYQTLSRGMVNLHNARKLHDVPFPFPLSQTVVALILIQSVVTPVFAASVVAHPALAALMSFLPIFGMWSLIFIAGQLEQPFGTDPNDLPLSVLQFDMNTSLLMLLEAKSAPKLRKTAQRSVAGLRFSLGKQEVSTTDSANLRRGLTGSGEESDAVAGDAPSSMTDAQSGSGTEMPLDTSARRTEMRGTELRSSVHTLQPDQSTTMSAASRPSHVKPKRIYSGPSQAKGNRRTMSHQQQLKEREERISRVAGNSRFTSISDASFPYTRWTSCASGTSKVISGMSSSILPEHMNNVCSHESHASAHSIFLDADSDFPVPNEIYRTSPTKVAGSLASKAIMPGEDEVYHERMPYVSKITGCREADYNNHSGDDDRLVSVGPHVTDMSSVARTVSFEPTLRQSDRSESAV